MLLSYTRGAESKTRSKFYFLVSELEIGLQ